MTTHSASAAATQPGFIRAPSAPFIKGIPTEIGYHILSFAKLNDFDNNLPLVSRTWCAMSKDPKHVKEFLEKYFGGKKTEYQAKYHREADRIFDQIEQNVLMDKDFVTRLYFSGTYLVEVRFKDDEHVSAVDVQGFEHTWRIGQNRGSEVEIIAPNQITNLPHPPTMEDVCTLHVNSIDIVIFNENTMNKKGRLQIKQGDKLLREWLLFGTVLGKPIYSKGRLACILRPPKGGVEKSERVAVIDFVNKHKAFKHQDYCSIQ